MQGTESYKHKFAKLTLARWLREAGATETGLSPISWRPNRGAPHYGVWIEYPFCLDAQNQLIGDCPVWDETGSDPIAGCYTFGGDNSPWAARPPTYDEVLTMGLFPIAILDVAIQHKGCIAYGLEVVHRHDISPLKAEYLRRIVDSGGCFCGVYRIDADWILSRTARPAELVCEQVA